MQFLSGTSQVTAVLVMIRVTIVRYAQLIWDRRIYESRLAMLAHSLSPWHANINGMIMFGAGSLDPLALQRVDKRAAMYVVLVSRGSLLRMLSKEWDRSDTGLVEFRRNLLENVITYLA